MCTIHMILIGSWIINQYDGKICTSDWRNLMAPLGNSPLSNAQKVRQKIPSHYICFFVNFLVLPFILVGNFNLKDLLTCSALFGGILWGETIKEIFLSFDDGQILGHSKIKK